MADTVGKISDESGAHLFHLLFTIIGHSEDSIFLINFPTLHKYPQFYHHRTVDIFNRNSTFQAFVPQYYAVLFLPA